MWPKRSQDSESASNEAGANAGEGAVPLTREGELLEQVARLERELAESQARALRAMADFQNFQRRAIQNEEVARQRGITNVAASVTMVLDHFDQALAQDMSKADTASVVAGMQVIKGELLKALQRHGVSVIAPAPNDEFAPGKHEAIMQQASAGIAPGNVVHCFQAGYGILETGGQEWIIRPAKVSVAPSE